MSLESILSHILNQANAEKVNILRQAHQEKEKIIQKAKQEAERLYQETLHKERALSEAQKQKIIVNARLEPKKNLLKAKQELIDSVFVKLKSEFSKDKFKKQQVSQDKVREVSEDIDFYLKRIRVDHETEIADTLFS